MTPEQVTDAYFDALQAIGADPYEELRRYVVYYASALVRNSVRSAERRAFPISREQRRERQEAIRTAALRAVSPLKARLELTDALLQLLPLQVEVGGTRTTWGAMTAEQHQLKINELAETVVGLEDTITRHTEAFVALQNTSVSCLNELAVGVAAAA